MHTGESQFVTGPREHPPPAPHARALRRRGRRRRYRRGRQPAADHAPRGRPQSAARRLRSQPAAGRANTESSTTPTRRLCTRARGRSSPPAKRTSAALRSSASTRDRPANRWSSCWARCATAADAESSWKAAASRCRPFSKRTCSIACSGHRAAHYRRRPAGHPPAAARDAQRLSPAAIPRVSHGRRRAVRLRSEIRAPRVC